ncbi:MAG: DUF423 domain-containing protein, partial [Proteobacteria bacterium]|nr:DUF423 domain-containing protein [Pseudomonadota bacterium]
MNHWIIAVSGIFGASGVVLGALGAHLWKPHLNTQALDIFNTGLIYLLVHAAVLLMSGLLIDRYHRNIWFKLAALLFMFGVVFFCGALLAGTVLETRAFAPFAPYGGASLIFAW